MFRIKKVLSGMLLAFLCLTFTSITPIKAEDNTYSYSPLIVSSYKVSNDIITPGETFDLTIEIENTDTKVTAKGVLIDLSFSDGINTVYPTLPQAYLNSIAPGAKEEVTFKMKASVSYSRSTAAFGVDMIMADRTNSTYFYAPVKTDTSSFKIISKSIPTEVFVGEKISAAVTFKSLIDERLSNVIFQIFVDGEEEAVYTANIGNISAEASKTQNIVLSLNEKGNHLVRAVLSYTINGDSVSSAELFSGTVNVSEAPDVTNLPIQESNTSSVTNRDKLLIFGCLGASLVLLIGIIIIAKKYN